MKLIIALLIVMSMCVRARAGFGNPGVSKFINYFFIVKRILPFNV